MRPQAAIKQFFELQINTYAAYKAAKMATLSRQINTYAAKGSKKASFDRKFNT